jgi:hypothetical protein
MLLQAATVAASGTGTSSGSWTRPREAMRAALASLLTLALAVSGVAPAHRAARAAQR